MAREAGGSFGKCPSIEMWIRENFTNTSVVNILKPQMSQELIKIIIKHYLNTHSAQGTFLSSLPVLTQLIIMKILRGGYNCSCCYCCCCSPHLTDEEIGTMLKNWPKVIQTGSGRANT